MHLLIFATRLSRFLAVLLVAASAVASPMPKDAEPEYTYLNERACAVYCGYNNQLCCAAGQVCYTDVNNQAQCSTGAVGGTSTVVLPAAASAVCRTDLGQTQCGSSCCDSGLYCQGNGVCVGGQTTVTATLAQTGGAATTIIAGTATAVVTTTVTPSTSSSSSGTNGLDGGSIAGIIIGVVVGIIVLVWMCRPIIDRSNTSTRDSASSSRRSRGSRSRR